MEQFKRAILKNNQRQMAINRRSIEALKAGRHVMAGWRDETAAMIAMWHEANRGLAQANAILRYGANKQKASVLDVGPAMAAEPATDATRADNRRQQKKLRRERRSIDAN